MTIIELIPTVKELSHTDTLLLLPVFVQELLQNAGMTEPQSLVSSQTRKPPMEEAEQASLTLEERRAFLKQPLADRRRILTAQAAAMHDHYQRTSEWQDLMAGDIISVEDQVFETEEAEIENAPAILTEVEAARHAAYKAGNYQTIERYTSRQS